MTSGPKENGTDVPHEKLSVEYVAKEEGYVYVYLSNDNFAMTGTKVEVYFDDFNIEQLKSPVISSQDYYPFGLTFGTYNKEN